MKYIIISATNRTEAYSLKMAKLTQLELENFGCDATALSLADLPVEILHPLSYKEQPVGFQNWQKAVSECSGLVFCIPEYNGAYPGILKLFIDMLKYPESLQNKPVALIGLSASSSGAVSALSAFSAVLTYLKAKVFDQRLHLPKCYQAITADGLFADPATGDALKKLLSEFKIFCATNNMQTLQTT